MYITNRTGENEMKNEYEITLIKNETSDTLIIEITLSDLFRQVRNWEAQGFSIIAKRTHPDTPRI
jgi:hypothetical protein